MENLSTEWKVHTPNLLKEIADNEWAMKMPLQIFGALLFQVAQRALELKDNRLNDLMVKLTLYEKDD